MDEYWYADLDEILQQATAVVGTHPITRSSSSSAIQRKNSLLRNYRLDQTSETHEYRLIAADTVDMAFLMLETNLETV